MPSTQKLRLSTIVLMFLGLWMLGCDSGGEPDILAVEPRVGAQNAENPVKITGKNFRDDIGYTVFFGTHRSPTVVIADDKTLVAKAPVADKAGKVDISIRADDGTAFILRGAYEYSDAGGNVFEELGETSEMKKGNLVY